MNPFMYTFGSQRLACWHDGNLPANGSLYAIARTENDWTVPYDFAPGIAVELAFDSDGRLYAPTRWRRLRQRVAQRCRNATRWFRPRFAVAAISPGTVTLARERWSWLRWRWVRIE